MNFFNKKLLLLSVACLSPLANGEAPYPSTYTAPEHNPTLITNATVLTGDGKRLEGASVYFVNGKIIEVTDSAPEVAANTRVIDGQGRWVTPGVIDVHSHLGVYPSPDVDAHSDGNEATAPVTAEVWAEHSIWPQDPGFGRALAGGVTTLQILPGSANLFGGRAVTLKNVASVSYQGMKFPGAPYGLKMACGENPKRVYGRKGSGPSTRMGNIAGYRTAWIKAQDYRDEHAQYAALTREEQKETTRPKRDLELETLAGVLDGEIIIHMHCYRADEMLTILDLAKEFDYKVGTFHHGVEAYKIADELAENDVCGALWADWWGFKMEAYDGIQENIALVDRPDGSCAVVHSDSDEGIQRLNQEAAKAMSRGVKAGLDIPPERAITWITSNAAKSLGIEDKTGTLAAGKMADVVLWSGNPFSVYTKADHVFIDGVHRYDRLNRELQPVSDFELGQLLEAGE
jgi:imidazolonepropionase-like amidohydrolase